ncbi:MAG: hypothetical protein ACREBQ_11480 [Nitrososphaerales archaeon]
MPTQEDYRLYEQRKAAFATKMAAYQVNLIKYQADLEEWNSLSDAEKAVRHAAAETENRGIWSLILAVAISIGLYVFFDHHVNGSLFWFVWIAASVVIVITAIMLSRFLGPVVRGVAYAIGVAVVAFFITLGLNHLQAHMLTTHVSASIILSGAAIGFLFGLVNKASAKPKPPTAPRHSSPPM